MRASQQQNASLYAFEVKQRSRSPFLFKYTFLKYYITFKKPLGIGSECPIVFEMQRGCSEVKS